jgi:hypothetical protein
MANAITLTKRERMDLTRRATSRTGRAEVQADLGNFAAGGGQYLGRRLRISGVQPRLCGRVEHRPVDARWRACTVAITAGLRRETPRMEARILKVMGLT